MLNNVFFIFILLLFYPYYAASPFVCKENDVFIGKITYYNNGGKLVVKQKTSLYFCGVLSKIVMDWINTIRKMLLLFSFNP